MLSRKFYARGPWRRLLSTFLVVAFVMAFSGVGLAETADVATGEGPALEAVQSPNDQAPTEEPAPPAEDKQAPAPDPAPTPDPAPVADPAPAADPAPKDETQGKGKSGSDNAKPAPDEQTSVEPVVEGEAAPAEVAAPIIAPVTIATARSDFPPPIQVPGPGCGLSTVADFWAGQNTDVGSVTVWNDGTNLYVRFDTVGGWTMGLTHLYVGTADPGDMAPGLFPYSHSHSPGVTSDLYTIPLVWAPGTTLYIAAHAEVDGPDEQSETAWAGQGTWPRLKFTFEVQPCLGSITVNKFNDLNRDGDQDAGEGPLAGWVFRLTGGPTGHTVDVTKSTDAQGQAVFTDLWDGTYSLTEESKPDWASSKTFPVQIVLPLVGTEVPDRTAVVDVGNYFVERPGISIAKTVDFTGDGVYGELESNAPGTVAAWRIVVTNTGNVALTDVVVTDTNGQSFGPISLAIGASATFNYTSVPTTDTTNIATTQGKAPSGATVGPVSDSAAVALFLPFTEPEPEPEPFLPFTEEDPFLPFTGGDLGILLFIGVTLAAAGVILRRLARQMA